MSISTELSDREIEILKLIATGASNKEIASQLNISINTVKVHVRNIFAKIGVDSRTGAAMYALNSGLAPNVSLAEFAVVETKDDGLVDPLPEVSEPPPAPLAGRQASSGRLIAAIVLLVVVFGVVGFFVLNSLRAAPAAQTIDSVTRWQALPDLPTARYGLGVAALDEKLYTIAGTSKDGPTQVVEIFDLAQERWLTGANKPTPVGEVGAAVIRGLILLPGGRLGSGEVSNILEIYDPRLDSWKQGAAMPVALSAYALAAYEGRLYLFGGWDGQQFTNQVFVYDIGLDSWKALPAMSVARGYAGAAIAGRKIYVIGGYDGKNNLSVNEIFDPDAANIAAAAWERGPELPVALQRMGTASIADTVYLFGGQAAAGQTEAIIVFVPSTLQWQMLDVSDHSFGEGVGAISWGSNLYVLGGLDQQGVLNTAWRYQAVYTLSFPVIVK